MSLHPVSTILYLYQLRRGFDDLCFLFLRLVVRKRRYYGLVGQLVVSFSITRETMRMY